MLCALILYVNAETYSSTSTSNDIFLRNFFMAGLFTLRVFARNLLRGSRLWNIFHISKSHQNFWWLLRLISRYTTYWTTATWAIYQFKFIGLFESGNTFVMLFYHKIFYFIPTFLNKSIYTWARLMLHDDIDFAAEGSSVSFWWLR